MKRLAALACLAVLVAIAGCSSKQEPPQGAAATPSGTAAPSGTAKASPSTAPAASPAAKTAAPTPTAPRPLRIVILAPDSYTIDGRPATAADMEGAAATASKRFAPPAIDPKTHLGPPGVSISVPTPEKCTFMDLGGVMGAFGERDVLFYELEGIVNDFGVPRNADDPGRIPFEVSGGVSFLPLTAVKPGDLKPLDDHRAALRGLRVRLAATEATPLAWVLAAARTLHAAGAEFHVDLLRSDSQGVAKIVLTQIPVTYYADGRRAIPWEIHHVAPSEPEPVRHQVETFGSASGDRGFGTVYGSGRGSGIGNGTGSGTGHGEFFSIPMDEKAHKIVYVIDRSGSMTDSIDYVKYELRRAIGNMDEKTAFHVIFYSSGPFIEMPAKALVAATDENKKAAFAFVDSIIPNGETDPSKALERAFAVGADCIYLLTDGEFADTVPDLVKKLNPKGAVTVHTIGFINKTGEAVLKKIAEQTGGKYKFVSEADLARLSDFSY
jgi:hypothetical protein